MSTLCRLLSLATVKRLSFSGQRLLWYEMRYLRTLRTFGKTTSRGQSRVQGLNESRWGLWIKPIGELRTCCMLRGACCMLRVHIHTSTSHLNWDFPLSYAVLNTKKWKSPKWKSCPYRFHSGFTCCSHGSVTLTSRKLFGLKLASYITTLLTIDDGPICLYLFHYNFAP